MKQANIVAIDTGNRRTKTAYWDIDEQGNACIKTDVFSSRVFRNTGGFAIKPGESTFFPFNFAQDSFTVYPDGHGGSGHPIDLLREGRSSGKAIKALFLTALIRNGFSRQPVAYISNLPVGDYFQNTAIGIQTNEALVNEKIELLSVQGNEFHDPTALPQLVSGRVFAEGCAAYIDFVMDDQGNEKPRPKALKIVDIGGGTIDTCVAHDDFSISEAQTFELGMLSFYARLRKYLFEQEPKLKSFGSYDNIDLHDVETWYHDKAASVYNFQAQQHEMIDISAICDACIKDYCTEIAQKVVVQPGTSGVLLMGGGALDPLIQHYLTERWQNVFIPKDPDFANVRGLLKLETFIFEKKYTQMAETEVTA